MRAAPIHSAIPDALGDQVIVAAISVKAPVVESTTRHRQDPLWRVASGIRCKSVGVVPGFMVRLGDGTDSFAAVGGLAGGDGAWPELGGWFEE